MSEVVKDPAEVYAKAPGQGTTIVHQRGRRCGARFRWDARLGSASADGREGISSDGQRVWKAANSRLKWTSPGKHQDIPQQLDRRLFRRRITVSGEGFGLFRRRGANGLVATFYFDKETGLLTPLSPVRHHDDGPRSDADRLLGLPPGGGRYDAAQVDYTTGSAAGRNMTLPPISRTWRLTRRSSPNPV